MKLDKLLPPRTLTWRFGVLVLLLTMLSVTLGIKASVDTNQNTRCLAQYAQRNADVSQARSDSTAAKDTARDTLLDSVTQLILHPGKDPAAAQKRLRDAASAYQRSKAQLAATRATNPLPSFPKECGDDNDVPGS